MILQSASTVEPWKVVHLAMHLMTLTEKTNSTSYNSAVISHTKILRCLNLEGILWKTEN